MALARRLSLLAALALLFAGPLQTAAAAPAPQGGACQFALGFRALHDLIPGIVGTCLTDEQHGANGDGLQFTANGLLVWRKADNFTAFTDGYRTWVNGPFGLQERLNTQRFDWEKGATVASTRVVQFVPPPATGQQVSGDCFASSAAATRADAWRCMAGNVIYDPCFSQADSASSVVCVRNPLDSASFVTMSLTQPLPAASPVPAETHPWFLQLADQTVCNFFTGATGGVDGERINYGCSDGWVVVGLPRPGAVWTAREVRLAPRSVQVLKSVTVQIATVWQ